MKRTGTYKKESDSVFVFFLPFLLDEARDFDASLPAENDVPDMVIDFSVEESVKAECDFLWWL
jgi:hypothetical protein